MLRAAVYKPEDVSSRSRQQMSFRCSLQCQINMNLDAIMFLNKFKKYRRTGHVFILQS